MQKGSFGIQIIVDGRALPEYEKNGKTYVAAPWDRDFKIRIITPSGRRTEAVLSVDGLSVMTGKDATADEGGYVIERGSADIPGFRLNDREVAAFHFGDRRDSYAAQLGKPRNVGVIAAKFFSERNRGPVYRADSNLEAAPGGGLLGGGGRRRGGAKAASHDMGTEFGDRKSHEVTRVDFRREREEATIVIEYASEDKLRKAGVIPRQALGDVDPFPGDNAGCKPPKNWRGRGRRR